MAYGAKTTQIHGFGIHRIWICALLIIAIAIVGCSDDVTSSDDEEDTTVELLIVSGDQQQGTVGKMLDEPLVVEVRDSADEPVSDMTILWSSEAGSLSEQITVSDQDGRARVDATLGTAVGSHLFEASIDESEISAVFEAEAGVDIEALEMEVVSGDDQTGIVSTELDDPFVVRVSDQYDNPASELDVAWSASDGGSLLEAATTTDERGLTEVVAILGETAGSQTFLAELEADTAVSVAFEATAELDMRGYIFFSAAGGEQGLWRASLDGSNKLEPVEGYESDTYLGVAADLDTEEIYYTYPGVWEETGVVGSTDYYGTDSATTDIELEDPDEAFEPPRQLALDAQGDDLLLAYTPIFVDEPDEFSIQIARLAGDVLTAEELEFYYVYPLDVAVHPDRQQVYFVMDYYGDCYGNEQPYDGAGYYDFYWEACTDASIVVEPNADVILMGFEKDGEPDVVQSIDAETLDATEVTLDGFEGRLIGAHDGKIYYRGENHTIRWANLDGSDSEILFEADDALPSWTDSALVPLENF